jgi:hypothetical protein
VTVEPCASANATHFHQEAAWLWRRLNDRYWALVLFDNYLSPLFNLLQNRGDVADGIRGTEVDGFTLHTVDHRSFGG